MDAGYEVQGTRYLVPDLLEARPSQTAGYEGPC